MSNVIIDREKIDILANAISDKSGVPVTMTLAEMVEAVDGIEVGGGTPTLETVTKTYTPSTAAVTDTITPSRGYDGIEEVDVTVSAVPTGVIGSGSWIDNSTTTKKVYRYIRNITQAGYLTAQSIGTTLNLDKESSTITPTESIQSVTPSGLYKYLDSVTVDAIPSNYVGSGITQRSSSDLTVSGATVTIPAGYYSAQTTKSVANGSAGTPTATKGTVSNHQVSVTPSVTNTAGYISGGTKNGTAVTVSASELVSGTYTVDSSGTKDVTNYASASVPAGTAGTPSASKGAVSNHSVSVTPSVTNTTGYITGGTKTGTAVSVSASELVSGNKAISANGTNIDVTNYATVSVNVPNNDVWKPIQAQTRSIVQDSSGNYLWYDDATPAFAEGQTWRVTWGNETYVATTKYVQVGSTSAWVIGNPSAVGDTDDGSGYDWMAWNPETNVIAVGTTETGQKKVILELQQSNPFQTKTVIYTPTETQQTATIVPDSGYNGLSTVGITVNAISSTYVGSGIARKSSTDLTVSGATVTAPAGYYAEAASKSVSSMTLPTTAASSATSGYTSKATIGRSTAAQYINIPPGYNSAGAYYVISAVANGSATGPTSLSGSSATITTGTNTITLTKTGVTTTPTVSAGYVSSATASTATVTLTASVTVNPTPTASGATVTIPAGYYSAQTTKSVTTMTLPTSAAASATSGYTKKATISRSTSTQYINIAPGYNSAGGYYEINAVANGSATGPTSLSGSSATVSTGTNTLTLTKTGVTTTPTVTAGYVSSATASTATVTLTASVTTQAAATITPTTTNQTIAAGTYLTGIQTIAGDADLIASNIKKDVNIFGVTGTYDPTDFIINLTQDSSNKWIPDCTFAEAEAALNSGKTLKFVAEYPAGDAYFAGYDDFGKTIAYGVIENTSTLNGTVLVDRTFIYNATNTVTQDLTFTYYETAQATAQASDVVSTKTFFNGSGYQTGTLDLTDIYIRSAAPTSSVGSDGDIYIQE